MKILITSVPAGSGHTRAAEALLKTFAEIAPSTNVTHLDIASLMLPSFRRLYVGGYNFAVQRTPQLWGRLYNFCDRLNPSGPITPALLRAQRSFSAKVYETIDQLRPDLILTTHFLIPQLLESPPATFVHHPIVETVITDYDVHQFWISSRVARYYVAHEDTAAALQSHGVSPARIRISGIPVDPCFSEPQTPSTIFRKLRLDPRRKVVLLLAGGLGLNALEDAVRQLALLDGDLQLVTVSGRNDALRSRLERLRVPGMSSLTNLGFVRNMHELLTISDVVVTKPGGLTISECLTKKKAMILFAPIPGQEERNAAFLLAQGAALRAQTSDEIPALVMKVLNDRALRTHLLSRVESCARPEAAHAIASMASSQFIMAA